jgi:ribosomal protein S18 acetylase RimI-like enzyme
MATQIRITEAAPSDAAELAAIHIAARRDAMPYLPTLHSDEDTVRWFVARLSQIPAAFRVARTDQDIVGYCVLHDGQLEDLYVRPDHQGRGVGSALLDAAKSSGPHKIVLSTFQQNTKARAFYEARGFREIGRSDGDNEERLPDIQYEWDGTVTRTTRRYCR